MDLDLESEIVQDRLTFGCDVAHLFKKRKGENGFSVVPLPVSKKERVIEPSIADFNRVF